jgi:predicted transposase/invertase (TIGR01784 family)
MAQNTILTYSEKAERKGRREGRKEGQKKVAKNLLEIGWDIEKVAETVDFTPLGRHR